MTEITEDVLRKVKKLLALSQSANEHEAAAAAAKAQELMFEYNLEISQVSSFSLNTDPVDAFGFDAGYNKRAITWKESILTTVARTSLCKAYYEHYSGYVTVRMIGRKSDVELAQYTFNYLVDELERLVEDYMVDQIWTDKGHARIMRSSWLAGASQSVRSTLNSEFEQRKAATEMSTALVATRDGEIQQWMNQNDLRLQNRYHSSNSRTDYHAYRAGQKTGATVTVRKGIEGSNPSGQLQ